MRDTRVYPGSYVARRRKCAGCSATWTSEERVKRGSVCPLPAGDKTGNSSTASSGQEGESVHYLPGITVGGKGGTSGPPPDPSGSALGNPESSHRDERRARRKKGVYSKEFLEFWAIYPRRVKKIHAGAAWESEKPPIDVVKAALAWQMPNWARSDIKYTPYPTSYINARRWEDEKPVRSNGTALPVNGRTDGLRPAAAVLEDMNRCTTHSVDPQVTRPDPVDWCSLCRRQPRASQ